MLSRLHLLFFVLLCSSLCHAQDWKTVNFKDTVYFSAGKYSFVVGPGEYGDPLRLVDSGYLRVAIVDSFNTSGSDSTFYFIRALRAEEAYASYSCVDTVAPGWLGKKLIRVNDGTEYYFNADSDTITLLTKAELNDTWLLAKNRTGSIEFWGTVSQKDTATVDGSMDSTKTISIQAHANGLPASHALNGQQFVLSKHHGWLKTFDLFRFPNDTTLTSPPPVIDASVHSRMPKTLNSYDINAIDLSWKYAPGNEWILWQKTGIGHILIKDVKVTYDSVISSTLLPGGAVQVDLFTRTYRKLNGVITTNAFYHTATVGNATTSSPFSHTIIPEYQPTPIPSFGAPPTRYYINSFCNKYLLTSVPSQEIIENVTTDTCVRMYDFESSLQAKQFLQGFGMVYSYFETDEFLDSQFDKYAYTYLNLGGCIAGEKIDVIGLDVNDVKLTSENISIYPNPATNQVHIALPAPLPAAEVELYDVYMRKVHEHNFSGDNCTLSTTSLPAGMYMILLKNESSVHTERLMVLH